MFSEPIETARACSRLSRNDSAYKNLWAMRAAGVLLCLVLPLAAQLRWIKDFKLFEHYEQRELPAGQSSQIKSLLTAVEAQPHLDGTADVRQMHLETYQPDGQTNLVAVAPACLVDMTRRTAGSPGRLEVRTGDGRFTIEGQGFFCQLTNAHITITNGVQTLIRKDAAARLSQKP